MSELVLWRFTDEIPDKKGHPEAKACLFWSKLQEVGNSAFRRIINRVHANGQTLSREEKGSIIAASQ